MTSASGLKNLRLRWVLRKTTSLVMHMVTSGMWTKKARPRGSGQAWLGDAYCVVMWIEKYRWLKTPKAPMTKTAKGAFRRVPQGYDAFSLLSP